MTSHRTSPPRWRAFAASLLIVVPLALTADAGKVRRVRSDGIKYVLDLTPEDGAAKTLVIEPGRMAWLSAAWGAQRHGVARMGRGLKWGVQPDSRRGPTRGSIYVEAEPLGDTSFEEAAEAYGKRVGALWKHAGRSLVGKPKRERSRRLRLARKRVPTAAWTMEVQRQTGEAISTKTILFPLADHLVAVTAAGQPDDALAVLKDLDVTSPDDDDQPRKQHVLDVVQSYATYYVIEPPAAFRLEPVDPAEDDRRLIARWRRKEPGVAPASLTLLRLSLDPTWSPKDALTAFQRNLAGRGEGEADEPSDQEVDGEGGAAITFRRKQPDEEPTSWGWLAAWKSGDAVFGLMGETTQEEAFPWCQAQCVETLENLMFWAVGA